MLLKHTYENIIQGFTMLKGKKERQSPSLGSNI